MKNCCEKAPDKYLYDNILIFAGLFPEYGYHTGERIPLSCAMPEPVMQSTPPSKADRHHEFLKRYKG